MPSAFFKILGTVMACAVIVLWCVVAAGTARGVWNGTLFFAPCLAELKNKIVEPQVDDIDETATDVAPEIDHPGARGGEV